MSDEEQQGLLGVNRKGNAILCVAWGETDRPNAMLAPSIDNVRQFIVEEWIGDKNDPLVEEVMQELSTHDWSEDGTLKFTFECGAMTFQDVVTIEPHPPNRSKQAEIEELLRHEPHT